MDFYDLTSWRHIAQNDPRADLPAVTTPRLVHHVNPEVRLILIVRDPVERSAGYSVLSLKTKLRKRCDKSYVNLKG
ncbi:hypothetical protein DPMN_072017 [Dreissena polymorpha]|uniref:Sulfotransferase n=1 Tax=Dreissena polymorpha TaxID=45954 RepID=A0A9D3Z3Q7_DREPO|nr:hypothetical protein DPMN_072017 [Dreissena polymorpha]